MTEWFRRKSDKIKTFDKRDTQQGQWQKCPSCSEVLYYKSLESNNFICTICTYHFRISSLDYFKLLFETSDIVELGHDISSLDHLDFEGVKKYSDQIEQAKSKTQLSDAITVKCGKIKNIKTVVCAMDFAFIGGSMGSVVGEKIFRAVDYANKHRLPLFIITSSGGARMQEGVYSLMQLAKISTKLAEFSNNGGLYIVLLTDPSTGGITASFGMQGDIILAEPNALIGFAGARVIKQTIGEDLPEGFQRSEFLLEKGFIDHIVNRNELKETLYNLYVSLGYKENNLNEYE
tara:strand:- start:1846 stop:2715 length:870 start_codon:yes stop_codon:yes gene_type:complete